MSHVEVKTTHATKVGFCERQIVVWVYQNGKRDVAILTELAILSLEGINVLGEARQHVKFD